MSFGADGVDAGADVAVLCSGFGLGFYLPGLLIAERLKSRGRRPLIEVYETLLYPQTLDLVERNRAAYHQDFRIALASQRIPSDIRQGTDPAQCEALFDRWDAAGIRKFLALSGHWVHVLRAYRERAGRSMSADLVYLDSDLSPSWRQLRKIDPSYAQGWREVRFYDRDAPVIRRTILVDDAAPAPLHLRSRRLVVHGGGWGIGTFRTAVEALAGLGYGIDVAGYPGDDVAAMLQEDARVCLDDPSWRTWHRDAAGQHGFPPFAVVSAPDEAPQFAPQRGAHGLLGRIRDARAIVSKPGAGTLIDSLSSATPLVLLEPFGPHEQRNAEVWLAEGLGVSLAEWSARGFPAAMLEELHQNLLARRSRTTDYAEELAATLGAAYAP